MESNRAPWQTLVWRAIWIIPTYTTRALLIAFVFLGWGLNAANEMWEATK